MPLDALKNMLVLPLLGLLVEKHDYPYSLTTRLTARYSYFQVRRSTVTTLINSLADAGLVHPIAAGRVNNRPSRTVYELTDAGFRDFRFRVLEQLAHAEAASPHFATAVAYVGVLSRSEAQSVLLKRAERLLREKASLEANNLGVPEIHMIEVAYWHTILAAEHAWIIEISVRIDSGDLEWKTPQ